MIKYILRRLGDTVPTLLGISLLCFLLLRMIPGDPVMLLLGERGGDPATYAKMERDLGLDRPLYEQFFVFLKNAVQGDLGKSVHTKREVTKEFFELFPATFELGLCALLWAALLGIPLGIIAAVKRNSFFDYSLMGSSIIGYSMPIFWWGPILILVFSVTLGWTPVSGRISTFYDVESLTGFLLLDTLLDRQIFQEEGLAPFWSALKHLILPSLAMGTIPLAITARMTRSSMLEVLGEDYIRTAKAKGLPFSKVVFVHALRNALIPIVTVLGLMFGTIITGAILTETIFSWPGIGRWLVKSISDRDYPVIQGGVLIIATMIVVINMAVDILYAVINPKMR